MIQSDLKFISSTAGQFMRQQQQENYSGNRSRWWLVWKSRFAGFHRLRMVIGGIRAWLPRYAADHVELRIGE
ncbi:hypothetical protein AO242_03490 [Pseudomonas sp. ICMP 561]|nr:hypothetical protein AO242_03490 [Pseudomonas sp. ICMP 561]